MSKTNFSSAVGESLKGRGSVTKKEEVTEVTASAPEPVKETKKTSPKPKAKSTAKKSNAGRKAKKDSEKKKQIVLTIKPESMEALAASDPDFKKLLSRYIDKNIDSIVEVLKGL